LNRAIFLDRDGVINELVYHQEQEVIDSPFTPHQFNLIRGVGEALKKLHQAGYLNIIISNQPGIAKGHMTVKNFELIRQKMNLELLASGAVLNGEYYCLHHPEAIKKRYRVVCNCRKPLPGLFLKAAVDKNINLSQSWLIGDNLSDIEAGKAAGCRTVLIGSMKCELCRLISEKNVKPDVISGSLAQSIDNYILSEGNELGKMKN